MIKQYKKKPVVVSAVKWDGSNLQEINTFTDNKAMVKNNTLIIPTLEGTMAAEVGSYIIKGVKVEYYPCRGDIFRDIYEEVKSCREDIFKNIYEVVK